MWAGCECDVTKGLRRGYDGVTKGLRRNSVVFRPLPPISARPPTVHPAHRTPQPSILMSSLAPFPAEFSLRFSRNFFWFPLSNYVVMGREESSESPVN